MAFSDFDLRKALTDFALTSNEGDGSVRDSRHY